MTKGHCAEFVIQVWLLTMPPALSPSRLLAFWGTPLHAKDADVVVPDCDKDQKIEEERRRSCHAPPPAAPTLAVKARKILRREPRTANAELGRRGDSCRESSFRVECLCGLPYKLPQRRVQVLGEDLFAYDAKIFLCSTF